MRIANIIDSFENSNAPKSFRIENDSYLKDQVISLNGRKLKLLPFIHEAVVEIKANLGKEQIDILDAFSGSGIVSRMFKQHSKRLFVNDLEPFSSVLNKCYLSNKKDIDLDYIQEAVFSLNNLISVDSPIGFIEQMYAPQNNTHIKPTERAFFSNENAKIIDRIRQGIDAQIDENDRHLFIAPLLVALSKVSNTMGVYRAFFTDSQTGIGKFPNLKNVLKRIVLEVPVLSDFGCETYIYNEDANQLVKSIDEVDLVYYDPPIDKYAYGENYFMFNIVASYERPIEVSGTAGIPKLWNRSKYNSLKDYASTLIDLLGSTNAKYILLSYNELSFLSKEQMMSICSKFGSVELKNYNNGKDSLFIIKVK